MNTSRLNSFTDGVVAIIITIMVLELPVPKAAGMAALKPELTLFAAYALAFVKVGIYWFQHHHLLQASRRVDGRVLLTNLFFLFWLSLVPFVVRWVGEAGVTRDTVLAFGVVMLLRAVGRAAARRAAGGERGRRADRQACSARAQGTGDDPAVCAGDRPGVPVAGGRGRAVSRRRRAVAGARQAFRAIDGLK